MVDTIRIGVLIQEGSVPVVKHRRNKTGGYIVQYEDGYVSWSPKSVFEKSYHSSETYLDRLIEEFRYEKEKLQNLQNFIRSETYSTLPVKKKRQLRIQHSIMVDFCDILYERITVEQCSED